MFQNPQQTEDVQIAVFVCDGIIRHPLFLDNFKFYNLKTENHSFFLLFIIFFQLYRCKSCLNLIEKTAFPVRIPCFFSKIYSRYLKKNLNQSQNCYEKTNINAHRVFFIYSPCVFCVFSVRFPYFRALIFCHKQLSAVIKQK